MEYEVGKAFENVNAKLDLILEKIRPDLFKKEKKENASPL